MAPSIADRNASAAIERVLDPLRVVAAGQRIAPCQELWRARHAVRSRSSGRGFAQEAAATADASRPKAAQLHAMLIAADAAAQEVPRARVSVGHWRQLFKDRQAAELPTDNFCRIDAGHGSSSNAVMFQRAGRVPRASGSRYFNRSERRA